MIFAVVLLLAATSADSYQTTEVAVVPDFKVFVNGTETPIYCEDNKSQISIAQNMASKGVAKLKMLRKLRRLERMTPEENQQLFGGELVLGALNQIIAIHQYAEYFCIHPEALPETKSILLI